MSLAQNSPSPRPLLVANWKMNGTPELVAEFVACFGHELPELDVIDLVICPPAVLISGLVDQLEASPAAVGAQTCHQQATGAFTGEQSAPMLKTAGCDYVIVGHSERRELFGEDDQLVAAKCRAVLQADMIPIVCVGESQSQRQKGTTEAVIREQINAIMRGLEAQDLARIVVAYEPVWAIGTGISATAEQAQAVHQLLRSSLSEVCDSESIRLLYGGSVKPDNAAELFAMPDIDGALVGGAALDAESFLGICRAAVKKC